MGIYDTLFGNTYQTPGFNPDASIPNPTPLGQGGLPNIFMTPDLAEAGLLGTDATQAQALQDALQSQATKAGLLSAGVSFLTQPRNLQAGSALPYLGRAYQQGMQSAGDIYGTGLRQYATQQAFGQKQGGYKQVDVGDKILLVDERTGDTIREIPKAEEEVSLPTPKFDEETETYMNTAFGTSDYNMLNNQQKMQVALFSNAPAEKDAADLRVKIRTAEREGVKGLPQITSRADYFRQLTQPEEPVTTVQTQPEVKVEPKQEGTTEIKAEIPLVQSETISPKEKEKLLISKPQTTASVEYAIDQTRQMRNTARRLLADPNLDNAFGLTGLGMSLMPGTPAADVRATLDTLKNQSFVQGLQAMRAASKTGGAVGNVSDSEGKRFESLRASLSQAQSAERAREELERLDKELEETEKRLSGAYSRTYGTGEFNVRTIMPIEQQATTQPMGQMPAGIKVRKIK